MEKFVKVLRAEIKDINTEKHTLTAIISTKKPDRDGDIVNPIAFKQRIKNYKEHPVLLSSHRYYDLRSQIGKANKIDISDNEVSAQFEYFIDQGNEEANWAWILAQKGIAAYSIGFMGHQFDFIKEKDEQGNERIIGRNFTDIELLEVSQVLVPSNRGALQTGIATAREEAELCEMAIKSFDSGELKMPIELKPKPDKDESKDDFMKRCIPQLIDEGKEKDQAVAICNSLWDNKKKDIHYSESILGDEAEAISKPKGELGIDDVTEAIKQAMLNIKGE